LAYLEGGADIIETASYQATAEGFQKHMNMNMEEAQLCIRNSATLAKTAVQKFIKSDKYDQSKRRPPLVAGSLGPYGVWLCDGSEYSGAYMKNVTRTLIEAMHLPRILALVDGGVDLLAVETMPSLEEVEIILSLVKEHRPVTKVWVSFAIKDLEDSSQTASGDSMEKAYEVVAGYPQVVAIGINCCKPSAVSDFLKRVKSYKASRRLKTIAYPNSGQSWERGIGWLNDPVPSLDEYLNSWLDADLDIVGGCCQVGVDQIARMRAIVDKRQQ